MDGSQCVWHSIVTVLHLRERKTDKGNNAKADSIYMVIWKSENVILQPHLAGYGVQSFVGQKMDGRWISIGNSSLCSRLIGSSQWSRSEESMFFRKIDWNLMERKKNRELVKKCCAVTQFLGHMELFLFCCCCWMNSYYLFAPILIVM